MSTITGTPAAQGAPSAARDRAVRLAPASPAPDRCGLPPALSSTHQHALAILATELPGLADGGVLRILDAGCGDGLLLDYLHRSLRCACPEIAVELYGFDVTDHAVQAAGFLAATVDRLSRANPEVAWRDRIRATTVGEAWPFPDGFFAVVLSNQVLEHVQDHTAFMAQTARVLAEGGIAFHIAPSRSILWEPHVHLPLAHRLRDHDLLRAYLLLASRLGLGRYGAHRRQGVSPQVFAEEHADYLSFLTHYRRTSELLGLARGAGLRPSTRYTEHYFAQRLRRLLGRAPLLRYARVPGGVHVVAAGLLSLLASTTLFLEKRQSYRSRAAPAGEAPGLR